MTDSENISLPPRRRLHLLFRLYGFLFDTVLARVRILLYPFWLLTHLWRWTAQIIYRLGIEYTKRRFGGCGAGVRIIGPFEVTCPGNLYIGQNVHINANAFLRAEGGLHIGDNTHIGRNLVVYTMNHNYLGERLPYDEQRIPKAVHIGRNVWIGVNVTIVPGVTIGDGAVVGMGTVVVRDVPPLAIVGSELQRIIKMRDAGHYETLDQAARYGGMAGFPWSPDEE